MMRIDGDSLSSDRPAQAGRRCPLCYEPLLSHILSCPLPPASSVEKVVEALPESSQEWARETLRQVLVADGSSSIRRGGTGSRSWSVTGSSGLVSRRLRRKKYDYIWGRVQSQLGTGTGKTSDSSKSSIEEADSIGTVPVADCDKGWMGLHLWGYRGNDMFNVTCLNCGRTNR